MSGRIRIETSIDRALGALYGLAIGDALGMPTQELDRASAERILGSPPGFRDGPVENPIAQGLPAGSITDDTMQCVLIANLLIANGGRTDPHQLADALLAWERDMAERGRMDLLGPSTKRALAALKSGHDPSVTGRAGTTNGAAMRITPVGISHAGEPIERLIEAVVAADRVTHDTDIAHAGAAAVAAVVSAGVEGYTFEEAAQRAIQAASRFGFGGVIVEALTFSSVDTLVTRFGTGVETAESVPTAFGLARLGHGSAWEACGQAAALGGDTDTIAALVGAMLGACSGLSMLPPGAVRKVREVNDLDFGPLARGLLALRNR